MNVLKCSDPEHLNTYAGLKYELKKNWKGTIFTSKFVGIGPSSFEKRVYRTAFSQRLRNTALVHLIVNTLRTAQHTVYSKHPACSSPSQPRLRNSKVLFKERFTFGSVFFYPGPVRLKIFPEIYMLQSSYCLVSMNNTVILSNETFIRFPGNIVKLFDRHGANKRAHILLRALYSSNISVFTDNRTASFVESSSFLSFACYIMSSTTVMVQTVTRNWNPYVDFPCPYVLPNFPACNIH